MDDIFHNRETLLNIKKNQESKIREIIKKRNIDYLVHFTKIENLNSILENGLVPVSLQPKNNIKSIHNDEQRIDSQLDCTSCSVEFPNYKLFYTFRDKKFPGTKWIMIVIDTDVLFSPDNISYYCQMNAACIFPRVLSVKELCMGSSLENMFCECITTRENKMVHRNTLQIGDNITTDPQAEILISDIISSRHIASICFQNQSDINEYVRKNGDKLINKFDHQVVSGFFEARKDYSFWKKEN